MSTPNETIKVMIVEDEFIIALDLKQRVKILGYEVVGVATSGDEAVELANKVKPQLIIMDIMLRGEIDGVQAAKIIRYKLDIPIMFISSFSDKRSIERANKISPYGYIVKPFTQFQLKSGIEDAHRQFRWKEKKSIPKKRGIKQT